MCPLPTPQFKNIVEETERLLRNCDQFNDGKEELALRYTAVLHNYNTGNLDNLTLSATAEQSFTSRSFEGYNQNTPDLETSNHGLTISLSIGAVIFAAVVIVVFVKYRRYRRESDSIVTYEPEFDLPEPDEELVSGTDITGLEGDEDDEINYELGELDDIQI
jgi:hypothetical protein